MFLGASLSAQQPATPPAPAPPHHETHHPDMGAMHAEHMQQMKDQVAKMRENLNQLKANLDKLTDPAVKQQAQLDVDLWEAMVSHLEGMVEMMSAHSGMGMGMHGAHPGTPPADKAPAPKQ
jgi:alpha-galactosidase